MSRTDADIESLLSEVSRRTGLVFRASHGDHLAREIALAMKQQGVEGEDALPAYQALVRHDPEAFTALIDRLTVSESYFFRDPDQFQFIRQTVIGELRAGRGAGATLRVWSAGCAGGEEAYSLAILLSQEPAAAPFRVVASDISGRSLERARAARYSPWSLRASDERFKERYFERAPDGRHQLRDDVRRLVDFRSANLLDSSYDLGASFAGELDLIVCRNVFIYFSRHALAQAVERICARLRPGGWFLTSASDPPVGQLGPLERHPNAGAYRRVGATRHAAFSAPAQVAGPPPGDLLEPPSARMSSARTPGTPAPGAEIARARRALARGAYQEALTLLANVPDTEDAACVYVRALSGAGQLDVAAGQAERAVGAHPLSTELHFLHALVLLERGEHRSAVAALERALYLDRSLIMVHFTLACALVNQGETARVQHHLRAVLRLAQELPGDSPVFLAEGASAGEIARAAERQLTLIGPGHEVVP